MPTFTPCETDSADSSHGGPLDFGFYVGFLLPSGGGGAEGVAVDNFDLVITPVPEPSSLGLAVEPVM